MTKPLASLLVTAAILAAGCAGTSSENGASADSPVPCPTGVSRQLSCTGNERALTISGRAKGDGTGAAIRLTMYTGNQDSLTLSNLELTDYAEAIDLTDILGCVCSLTLQNVTLARTTATGDFGIRILLGSGGGAVLNASASDAFAVRVDGLRIAGYQEAISIESISKDSVMDGVEIDCLTNGMVLFGGPLRVSNSHIRNCTQIGIDAHSAASLEVATSTFDGNGVGLWMYAHRGERPRIHDSSFTLNGAGIVGSLRTDTGPPLPCQSRDVVIQNATFEGNGRSSDWLASSGIRPGAVLVGPSGATILDSSFAGNDGVAVGGVGIDGQAPVAPFTCYVTATDNWWGSALGPSRGVDQRAIGLGDIVDAGTEVDPFLRDPPVAHR